MPQTPPARPDVSVIYVASEEMTMFASQLPSNKNRSVMVHKLAIAMGLFSQIDVPPGRRRVTVIKPPRASYRELAVYHSRDYLDYVLNPENFCEDLDGQIVCNPEFGLEDDCPPFPGLPDYVQFIAGASLLAANLLRHGKCEVAICWDGGRHHAQKSLASGFCYVADCVLAILALKRQIPTSVMNTSVAIPTERTRVMYLDLDLHFSNAVSQAFYARESSTHAQVLTFSIHHAAPGFFPDSPLSKMPDTSSLDFDPLTLSLPLHCGASSSTFLRIWPIVECVKDTFRPDFLVVQCGVDGLAGDPSSTWNWSLGEGDGSLGWCINRIVNEWSGRKLFLGGGGYNHPNAARAWTYLTSVVVGSPLSLEVEIPDHSFFPLYAPSFTLDIPPGNMQDLNTDDYLSFLEHVFRGVVIMLKERMDYSKSEDIIL